MTGDSQVSTYMPALSLSNVSSFLKKKEKWARVYVYQYMCVYDLCTLLAEEGNNEVQGLYYPLD